MESRLDDASSLLRQSLVLAEQSGLELVIPWCLFGLAAVAAERGDARRGASLLGAGDRLAGTLGMSLSEAPFNRMLRERTVARLRRDLREDLVAESLAEGRSMTVEEAVARALETARNCPPRTCP